MNKEVSRIYKKYEQQLIQIRHDIHAYPEPAFEEFETAKKVCSVLERIPGIEIQKGIATTGVVATLGAHLSGPCIALRADMDCLPIREVSGLPYASTREGYMHACGHDGHTSCLLGAALVLGELQQSLKGPVKFIFQPAEENGGGGRYMVEAGVLKNPDVDAIFGLHGWPALKVGEFTSAPGAMMAGEDSFTIKVEGMGAHSAAPHTGIDPIVVMSHIVTSLQTIVSRSLDPLKNLVVTVSKIEAGTASNIIPSDAELLGTIRCFDEEVREMAITRIKEIATHVASAHGAKASVLIHEGYPTVINDAYAYEVFEQLTLSHTASRTFVDASFPVMASEDFSYFAQEVPGLYWALGVCPKDKEYYPSLHNNCYDFTDEAIQHGVELHADIALRFADVWKAEAAVAA